MHLTRSAVDPQIGHRVHLLLGCRLVLLRPVGTFFFTLVGEKVPIGLSEGPVVTAVMPLYQGPTLELAEKLGGRRARV